MSPLNGNPSYVTEPGPRHHSGRPKFSTKLNNAELPNGPAGSDWAQENSDGPVRPFRRARETDAGDRGAALSQMTGDGNRNGYSRADPPVASGKGSDTRERLFNGDRVRLFDRVDRPQDAGFPGTKTDPKNLVQYYRAQARQKHYQSKKEAELRENDRMTVPSSGAHTSVRNQDVLASIRAIENQSSEIDIQPRTANRTPGAGRAITTSRKGKEPFYNSTATREVHASAFPDSEDQMVTDSRRTWRPSDPTLQPAEASRKRADTGSRTSDGLGPLQSLLRHTTSSPAHPHQPPSARDTAYRLGQQRATDKDLGREFPESKISVPKTIASRFSPRKYDPTIAPPAQKTQYDLSSLLGQGDNGLGNAPLRGRDRSGTAYRPQPAETRDSETKGAARPINKLLLPELPKSAFDMIQKKNLDQIESEIISQMRSKAEGDSTAFDSPLQSSTPASLSWKSRAGTPQSAGSSASRKPPLDRLPVLNLGRDKPSAEELGDTPSKKRNLAASTPEQDRNVKQEETRDERQNGIDRFVEWARTSTSSRIPRLEARPGLKLPQFNSNTLTDPIWAFISTIVAYTAAALQLVKRIFGSLFSIGRALPRRPALSLRTALATSALVFAVWYYAETKAYDDYIEANRPAFLANYGVDIMAPAFPFTLPLLFLRRHNRAWHPNEPVLDPWRSIDRTVFRAFDQTVEWLQGGDPIDDIWMSLEGRNPHAYGQGVRVPTYHERGSLFRWRDSRRTYYRLKKDGSDTEAVKLIIDGHAKLKARAAAKALEEAERKARIEEEDKVDQSEEKIVATQPARRLKGKNVSSNRRPIPNQRRVKSREKQEETVFEPELVPQRRPSQKPADQKRTTGQISEATAPDEAAAPFKRQVVSDSSPDAAEVYIEPRDQPRNAQAAIKGGKIGSFLGSLFGSGPAATAAEVGNGRVRQAKVVSDLADDEDEEEGVSWPSQR